MRRPLAVYSLNPVCCKHCGKPILPKEGERPGSVRRKKFCDHGCAAAHNNRVYPKRKPEGECDECGELVKARRKWCSIKCKAAGALTRRREAAKVDVGRVVYWRQRQKQKAVEYKGGKCQICDYNKCIRALKFHHVDPTTKEFAISGTGKTRSWERIRAELDKCVLVCGNCHDEIHAGIVDIRGVGSTGKLAVSKTEVESSNLSAPAKIETCQLGLSSSG